MDRRSLISASLAGGLLATVGAGGAAARAATARRQIMSLGWYVIFGRPSMIEPMTAFYGQTLGLPMLLNMRGPQQYKNHFWAGEDILIDLSHHALETPLDPREADPSTARQVAFFRTDDLDAVTAAIRARGGTVLPTRPTAYGREAFVVDPMGRLVGFRQREAGSPLAADREALRRRRRGEAFNPGCASMPPHVQELGWVRIRVADPSAAARFYGARLGLASLGTVGGAQLFDLGDNTTLEILPGGVARPRPAEQRAAETVIIERVVDFPALHAELAAKGQEFPYKIYDLASGGFSYVSDSEGNLVGLADRKPPGSYRDKEAVVPADLEARRRWVEATAGRE